MTRRRCSALGLTLWALLSPALPARPLLAADKIDYDKPPQGIFIDDWMLMEIQGLGRVGYLHNEVSRDGDVITTRNLMSMSLKRVGNPVGLNVFETTTERIDGTPLGFDSVMDLSVQKMLKSGVIEAGKVTVSETQFGRTTTNVYDYPEGAVMSWGMLREQDRRGYEPGTKYSMRTYVPSTTINDALDVQMEVREACKIDIDGQQLDAIHTVQQMHMPGMPLGGIMDITTDTWITPQGDVLRTTVPMMGMSIVMTRATKAKAMEEFSPPEFFMPTTITVDQGIDRQNAQSVEFLLALKDPNTQFPPLPQTPMQTSEVTPQGVRLTVTRLNHAALHSTPATKHGDEWREFLAPNAIIDSDDPAIVAMAEKARGDAKGPYEIADRLRHYVTDTIKDKNLNVGFATASEVCRNREGDCSEHAVLLAALGRASGLPSRVVTGLVYVPTFSGHRNIFGFHMWAQVAIGETWVDFDAAQGESDCNPTHIALSVDSLQHSGLAQVAFPLIKIIGNLTIKIDRVTPPDASETE